MPLAQITIVVSALLGWSDIEIQPSRGDRAAAAYRSVATLDRPTERTVETLRRYNLERDYSRRFRPDVNGVLLRIEKLAQQRAEPELVYALAELSWIEAKRLERHREPQALDRYLDTAAYAFHFLFDKDPVLDRGRKPADPRYRQAMELYNASVDHLIRAAMNRGEIRPENGKVITFQFHGGERKLQFVLQDSAWMSTDVHKLLLATDFEVSGLNKDYHQYGIGVPLIAIRETQTDKQGRREQSEQFYPFEMAFPLTAFLVPNSRLKDSKMDQRESHVCRLELIDPIQQQNVSNLPMEIDLTTPLAYMWSHTDLDRYRWAGLMRPEKNLERANLLLIRPYERDKIPVVMVHGLISSPLAWIPMLNELLRDPDIQKRCQFFLYMYPTGVPLPIAAAGLRDSLKRAQQLYDPDGRDRDFNRMVLLGHSMGGLLSHMMSVSSGDELWGLYSDRAFATEIIGPRETLDELHHYLFFEPLPFVSQVVFLATPHRGSDLSRGVVGRVGNGLISDPDHIHRLLYRLVKDNPDAFDSRRFRRFPTSIETLDTNSDMLLALLKMKPGERVLYHSIIGSYKPTGVRQSTDTVVPYTSSHLDGVVSEKVVRSDHGVQKAPEAIIEVRRILREHLGIAQPGPGVQEARAPGDAPSLNPVPPTTLR
jgi:hypothetical protein